MNNTLPKEANQKDLSSLKEMKECHDKIKESPDIVAMEMLGTLIDDWIDELNEVTIEKK